MNQSLGTVTLRAGGTAEAVLVRGPDEEWAERIEAMLQHKGDPWNWQNSELLRCRCGVDARFFILHRAGVPFANVMLVECGGVALLGHVWTAPTERRSGASSLLMERLLQDFLRNGGKAIFLGTEFDTSPWHYYRRRGFEPVEPGSGYMARYESSAEAFEQQWFQAEEAVIEPLDWPHWVTAAPLCLAGFPGNVRLAAVRLCGRRSSEEPLLGLIRENRRRQVDGGPVRAMALRDARSAAVLGLACRRPHPLWPDRDILDVYCHPRWWHRAGDLLAALPSAGGKHTVAYVDRDHLPKQAVLAAAGLRLAAVLPSRLRVGGSDPAGVSVAMFDSLREA